MSVTHYEECPNCKTKTRLDADKCNSCGMVNAQTVKKKPFLGIWLVGIVLLAVTAGIISKLMEPKNIVSQLELIETRLAPHEFLNGHKGQQVIIRIKNNGPEPIAEVWGDIHIFDKNGSETPEGVKTEMFFAADPSSLAPGQEFKGRVQIIFGETYIQGIYPRAASASVRLTHAFSKETGKTPD